MIAMAHMHESRELSMSGEHCVAAEVVVTEKVTNKAITRTSKLCLMSSKDKTSGPQ